MSFLKRIFSGAQDQDQPGIPFGRYTDSYKEASQYAAWDRSLEHFEKDEHLEAFRSFFEYLKDESVDNVQWKEENGVIHFELLQGSKRVHGIANSRKLKAEAKVARVKQMNIGFMRRLIEQNFDLKYSRFSIDDENDISILFDTYTLDSSPYKLYYALKEIATNADKQDDLLIDEFDSLQAIENHHLEELPMQEKEVKYQFIQDRIERVFKEIEKGRLQPEQYPGAIAYLFLDLCYQLDYLVTPEGFMMELLERLHRKYFENSGNTIAQKNVVMRREFEKLKARSKEDFFREMYRVKATFGITTPVSHDKVVSFIDGELHNMDWYKDNRHDAVACAIPGYIIGFCLFNYSVPPPVKELFHLYYQITEPEYFTALGFNIHFNGPKKLLRKPIQHAIDAIEDRYKKDYPKFSPDTSLLKYTDRPSFVKSFLQMVRELEVVKED